MKQAKAVWCVAGVAALGMALAAVPRAPEAVGDADERVEWPQSGETTVLLDVADDLNARERAEFVASLPGDPALNSEFSDAEGLYRLTLPAQDAQALADALQGDERVEFLEPEQVLALDVHSAPFAGEVDADASPNDPLYPFQWHFDQVELERAWGSTDGGGAVVAVIDTGVAYADDDAGRLRAVRDLGGTGFVPGYDFVDDDDEPLDEHGHGTHVAGTVAQTTNNAYGVAGIAPGARIMPIRVLDRSGRGNTADIAESVRWAADNGADIINMSLGGPLPSRIMQDAVAYAHRKGVTVIAAAGNSGWSMPSYPAAYPHVIAVGATQYDRTTTFYSNYGKYLDIAAPGGNVRVDQNDDGRPDGVLQETLQRGQPGAHEFALYMGTSMAAPHVAGIAALVHSGGVTHPDRVEDVLLSSASTDVPNYERDRYGAGIVDAGAATKAGTPRRAATRALPALLFGLLLAMGRRNELHAGLLAGSALGVVGSGALLGLGAGALGVSLAPLFAIGHSALWLSALPVLGAFAFLGGTRSRAARSALVGFGLGMSVLLGLEALAPTIDVLFVPGVACLDQAWLGLNAILAGVTTWVAAQPKR